MVSPQSLQIVAMVVFMVLVLVLRCGHSSLRPLILEPTDVRLLESINALGQLLNGPRALLSASFLPVDRTIGVDDYNFVFVVHVIVHA